MQIKKYFLILSSFTIFGVGLLYGVSPHWFARTFLGVSQLDLNLAHILRAMMCLYFGFALFWLFAAFSRKYRNAALVTVVLFPAGLLIGESSASSPMGNHRRCCSFTSSQNSFRLLSRIGFSGFRNNQITVCDRDRWSAQSFRERCRRCWVWATRHRGGRTS